MVLEIKAAALHTGRWRQLVHRLKYRADLGAGAELAALMAALSDDTWSCLLPVPRARVRRLRYGIDPARWLAGRVAEIVGIAVVDVLRPQWWWPPHAGAVTRRPPGFYTVDEAPAGALLVDDVVTTGATLGAASAVTGIGRAVVATRAPFVPKDP
jgi:predicted amidophosphoribosyltransferase